MMRPGVPQGPHRRLHGVSITHLPDIGGSGFGSSATEIYHEGLRLPICKLYEAGRLNDLVRRDHPHQRAGARADHGRRHGQRRLQRGRRARDPGLHGRVWPRGSDRALAAPSAASPRRRCGPRSASSRTAPIATSIRVEGFAGPVDLRRARSTIKGDSVVARFRRARRGCVRAGVNVPFCYTNAMVLHAIKSLTLPSIPNNQGSAAPITAKAPPGCILNALPPFPTGGRHAMGHFVTPLIYGALAEGRARSRAGRQRHDEPASPSKARGATSGRSRRSISRPAAMARSRGLDGWSTLPHPSNMAVVPVEVWETLTHTTVVLEAAAARFRRPRAVARRARPGGGRCATTPAIC